MPSRESTVTNSVSVCASLDDACTSTLLFFWRIVYSFLQITLPRFLKQSLSPEVQDNPKSSRRKYWMCFQKTSKPFLSRYYFSCLCRYFITFLPEFLWIKLDVFCTIHLQASHENGIYPLRKSLELLLAQEITLNLSNKPFLRFWQLSQQDSMSIYVNCARRHRT